jgi:TraM recognition site of TraD and TraG/Type IV secretory system Conjugative DNA transfer
VSAPQNPAPGPKVVFSAIGAGTVLLGGLWVSVWAGAGAAGQAPLPGNPIQLVLELVSGKRGWPGGMSTVVGVGMATAVVGLMVLGFVLVLRHAGRGSRADKPGRRLAGPGGLRGIRARDTAASAARLRPGAQLRTADDHGVALGRTVTGNKWVRMDWESVGLCIAGPRTGKSMSLAIPAIAAAPGPVVATSNKPDLHDATRTLRAQNGARVWLFDPQQVAGANTGPQWWVDLLGTVGSPASARTLVGYFAEGARSDPNARIDAYFEGEAQVLLSTYLLAAALAGGDLLHVASWLAHDNDLTAVTLLRQHGQPMAADKLLTYIQLSPKQKDGLYGSARAFVAVLDEPAYAAWVTPPARVEFLTDTTGWVSAASPLTGRRPELPQFDPHEFITSTRDTLYALSMEGPAAATGLTTALVAQIFDAGQHLANTFPTRRLPTPVLFILDEVANVVKIKELPDLYSHFGSRGLPVLSILQSWSQGEQVWGEKGMAKMWSAANVKFYGGGVAEARFLTDLSHLIGDHDVQRWSTTRSRGNHSRSQSWTTEPIFTVADLAALPRGRAVLLSSGNEATLLRTVAWTDGPHAQAITASIRDWAPAGAGTAGGQR